jgi:hypothetical protein
MGRTITIGFSKPKNKPLPVFSWLIRLYEGTTFSHTYLRFHSESLDRHLVYEAVGGGVRFIGQPAWSKYAEEVDSFTISVSDEARLKLLQYCVDSAGMEYGFIQNLGLVVARLFKLKYNPTPGGKNCSEIIAEVLQMQGYKLPKEPNLMTPKDIHLTLSQGRV